MCWRRIQEGKKKQPDYIVVFRKDDNIFGWEYAKQAQNDFGGKLPIVIIDIDKCLENERKEVEQMVLEYKKDPTLEMAEEIRKKIRNNSVTDKNFCSDLNLDFLSQDEKKGITESELKEIYEEITPQERKKQVQKISMLIKEIDFER